MTPREAMALLGLSPGFTEAALSASYAQAVAKDHPDHGGTGSNITRLKLARDVLKTHGEITPCILCRGSGKVRGRFGARTCTACEGSGDQQ